MRTKSQSFVDRGIIANKARYFIPGSHSPVRTAEGADLSAIVRPTSREINHISVVQLFRLKVNDDQREVQMSKSGYGNSAVPFESAKYGEKSLRIRPKSNLPPGDYAFSLTTSQDGDCFGIDPK